MTPVTHKAPELAQLRSLLHGVQQGALCARSNTTCKWSSGKRTLRSAPTLRCANFGLTLPTDFLFFLEDLGIPWDFRSVWKSILRRVSLRTVVHRFVAPIRVATVYLALAVLFLQVERGSFSTVSGFLLYATVLLCYAGLASTSNCLSYASTCYLMVIVYLYMLCYATSGYVMLCYAVLII